MRHLNKKVWPYQISMVGHMMYILNDWCADTLGKENKNWYSYEIWDNVRIYAFRDSEILLAFKLTWGNYEHKKDIG
jgi:hypothetical protein